MAAAARIFSNVPFERMSREEVLEILGDPATIGDYGVPAGEDPDSPLVYRFDSGYDGQGYTLHFKAGRVVRLDRKGID